MFWDVAAAIVNGIAQFAMTWYAVRVSVKKGRRTTALVMFSLGAVGILLTGYLAWASEKAQQALMNEATGGNSYGVLLPIAVPVSANNTVFQLFLVRKGEYPLYDVNVTMFDGPMSSDVGIALGQVNSSGIFSAPSVSGTLLLPRQITPALIGTSTYWINVVARNGTTKETLQLRNTGQSRRLDGTALTLPWEFSYEATRDGRLLEQEPWHPMQYDTKIH